MNLKRIAFILLILSSLAACTGNVPLKPSATTPPQASATLQQPSHSLLPMPAAVSTACPLADQAKALARPLDLTQLGISTCYQLSLTMGGTPGEFSGQEKITFANPGSTTLKKVVLRTYPNARNIYGGQLNISTLAVNGQPVEFQPLLSDQTAVEFALPAPLLPGQVAAFDLTFSLRVNDARDDPYAYGIFNLSGTPPVLTMANGYPILAHLMDGTWDAEPVLLGGDAVTSATALYDVTLDFPAGWQVAATGVRLSDEARNERHVMRYVSGPVRDFMLTASPAFIEQTTRQGDVTIHQWGVSANAESWAHALQTSSASMAFYNAHFGAYPFTELDVVAVPLQNASGVEYPGLILIIDNDYETRQSISLEIVLAHEIAHQWWYSIVGNDVYRAPWIDEGLTTYSTLAYLQETAAPIYQDQVSRYATRVSDLDARQRGLGISSPVSRFQGNEGNYSIVVYQKSALFFKDLRQQIGDETFFNALKAYYASEAHQIAAPTDLVAAFETSCSCSLRPLLEKYGALTP